MDPEIVERSEMLMAGVIYYGKAVAEIDIHGLWQVYDKSEPAIPNRIDGTWYELHVGKEQGNGVYSVFVGVAVSELGELPVEVCLKVIPAGKYAHFEHFMKDGGFGEAFAGVESWVKESGTKTADFGLQLYDSDFDPSNENSILHIYIPLA
jgi:predicted transcriptional regulator YdeE